MNIKGFPIGHIQEFIMLLTAAESEGITDVVTLRDRLYDNLNSEYRVQYVAKSHSRKLHRNKSDIKCPVCGHAAVIVEVNTNKENNVGGGFTHSLQCLNKPSLNGKWESNHCGYTQLLRKSK